MFVVKRYDSENGDDGIWETEIGEFKNVLDAIDEMKHENRFTTTIQRVN